MKSKTRQTKQVDNFTQQKLKKRKSTHIQSQSSEYLKDVIYQSSSSSSSSDQQSYKLKYLKPQQKKQLPLQVLRQAEQRANSPVNSYEGSVYDDDSECEFNDATAQKSKRLNHSSIFQINPSKLSNQHGTLQALNQTIDEPKQSQISRFHLTKTPKMIIEMHKKQEKRGKDRNQSSNQRPQRNGFQFVKLQNTDNSVSQERRYPYRASREVPPLKFWQGQKMDIKRNGYWRKSS